MSQIFESIRLALSSIWANKLRSLLTLLGNIVAVSSIITVVSLIQGMNATVSDAVMSDLGADTFTIDRMGMITSEEEMDRARNNPRVTIEEAEAIERFSDNIQSVMAQATTSAPIAYGNEEIESVRIQGVSGDYADFSTFDAERGRMISPTEIERSRPVGHPRMGSRRPPLRRRRSDRQGRSHPRRPLPRRRRQRKEGRDLRQLDGLVRRRFPSARSASCSARVSRCR